MSIFAMGMRLPQIPRALFAALAYDLDLRASRGRLAFQRISGALHGSAMQLRRKKRRIVIREFADAL